MHLIITLVLGNLELQIDLIVFSNELLNNIIFHQGICFALCHAVCGNLRQEDTTCYFWLRMWVNTYSSAQLWMMPLVR